MRGREELQRRDAFCRGREWKRKRQRKDHQAASNQTTSRGSLVASLLLGSEAASAGRGWLLRVEGGGSSLSLLAVAGLGLLAVGSLLAVATVALLLLKALEVEE